jgi:hypothetical protein
VLVADLKLNIGDIVEYKLPFEVVGKSYGLGLITKICEGPRVHPLCCRIGEEISDGTEIILVEDESQESQSITSNDIIRVIEDAYFSQRPIEDRKLNPHGEHSEDVYLIKTNTVDIHKLFLDTTKL